MSFKIDCGICAEENVISGVNCDCGNVVCVRCQAKMEKCPFCRRAFPNLIERLSRAGTSDEVFQIYSDIIDEKLSDEKKMDKICLAMSNTLKNSEYRLDVFEALSNQVIQDNTKIYAKLIKFLEEDLAVYGQGEDEKSYNQLAILLYEFHYSEVRLIEQINIHIQEQVMMYKEDRKVYQTFVNNGLKKKKRTSRENSFYKTRHQRHTKRR